MSGLETVDVFAFWVCAAGICFMSAIIFLYLYGRYRLTGIVPLLNARRRGKITKENLMQ